MKPLTVAELIEFLKTQPQHLLVGYCLHSEWCLMETEDIGIVTACEARPDGWIQDRRDDKPLQQYLIFPGN